MATGAVAILAGGDGSTAVRLGLSMVCLQASIGAFNDVVDAPLDARAKPAKPIPSGVVSVRDATVLGAIAGLAGLALSLPSGLPTVAVAALGLGLGYAYDARLSRSRWSWLPLSLALPLLPIHAWLGASGTVPPGLITLVPAAIIAGTALAIANGLVDIERDALVGRQAVAVELGRWPAWAMHAGLLAILGLLAVFVAPAVPGEGSAGTVPTGGAFTVGFDVLRTLRGLGVAGGMAGLALGAMTLAMPSARVRERGWELEAVAVAAIGLGWLAGAAAAPAPTA